MIAKENLKDLYPLTPMQEAMLFHSLAHPESSAYYERFCYRLNSAIDASLLVKVWDSLENRHEILRTTFIHEKAKRPLQAVLKQRPIEFHRHDLRHLSSDDQELALRQARETDRERGFNLTQDSLLRVQVFFLNDNASEVMLSFHHIILDGWSMGILMGEFNQLLTEFQAGRQASLPPVTSYARYVQWLERRNQKEALEYWTKYLSGYSQSASLPKTTTSRPYELRVVDLSLGPDLSSTIRARSAAWAVTPSTFFQGVWGILLSRYTGQGDLVFGAVVSGRPSEIAGVEKVIGLFINLVPVRVRIDEHRDCRTLMTHLQQEFLNGEPHHYSPLAEIAARTPLGKNLLDHALVFENYPVTAQPESAQSARLTDRFEQTNFDLLIVIAPGDNVQISFHFNASVYDPALIGRLSANFRRTVESILENPQLRDVDILSAKERDTIATFNSTAQPFPSDQTLVSLFKLQAAIAPEATAVSDESETWTYSQLDSVSNGLANLLISGASLRGEDRIAVLLNRSRWLPAALLGILKAGAVYLPIDRDLPQGRVESLLKQAGCSAVVTDSNDAPFAGQVINIAKISPSKRLLNEPRLQPANLAYMIFTSGSTGQPKAVMISHAAAINLACWHRRAFNLTSESRGSLFASPGFDASVWEMLPYLLVGASLHCVPESARLHPESLIRFYLDSSITHTFLPPAVCEAVCREHGGRLRERPTLLSGGDTLAETDFHGATVVNNYGPTESAVVATSIRLQPNREISIGRPIDNTEILILDSSGRVQPIGAVGEIHLASAGLARGYWNAPGATAEAFRPHPLRNGERIYQTGDTGAWRTDGTISFRGRLDHQVKIRGFRVELGEIESILATHERLTEAVVIATPDPSGDLVLTALITSSSNHLTEQTLRNFLTERLPRWMVPARFIFLDVLPRTDRGKIDRAALVQACSVLPQTSLESAPPSTPIQLKLAQIWSQVLSLQTVGIHDNFFELGGHSLKAVRIMSQVRDAFTVDLPLQTLFDSPTIRALELAVENANQSPAPDRDSPVLAPRPRRTRAAFANPNGATANSSSIDISIERIPSEC